MSIILQVLLEECLKKSIKDLLAVPWKKSGGIFGRFYTTKMRWGITERISEVISA